MLRLLYQPYRHNQNDQPRGTRDDGTLINSGLSEEEAAVRMDVPVDYVKECMKS